MPPHRFSRFGLCEYLIVLVCMTLIAGVWILTLERIRYERGEAVSDTVNRNANLALGFGERRRRIMKNVDHTVIALKHHYERYGRDIRVPDVFTEGNVPDPLVANFAIADEHGRLLLSKANFAPAQVFDREYFRVHQPRDSGQLFIGTPIKGRVSGKSFIPVSRRINKPDGSFAGVAMVGIDTGVLHELLSARRCRP